ncbi:MAG: hypothetical protein K8T25_14445, partial [Planctomycetia bacterium]|nr:hypothetical protein [Planctomycetia bacterium]
RFATQIIEDDDADEIAAMDAADHDVDVVDVTVIEDAANDHDAIAPVAETSYRPIFDEAALEEELSPVDIIIGLSETAPFIAPSAGLAQVTAGALPQALTTTPDLDDDTSEPATVRMADFGRPKQTSPGSQAADSPRQHEPWDAAKWNAVKGDTVSIPFLPAAERPYRQACGRILASAVESHTKGLVLAWVDESLDHSPALARLTAAMAERLDDPVLVIDVGAQRRLAALLHATAESRLPQAMAGLVSWRDLLVQTNTAGLCVLPSAAGDFDADPVAVARLLEACKADFGLVIVAGAALSAVPENLLSACEGAVLLVEAGYTPAAAAVDAGRRLSAGGAQLLGCLLTNAETA